MFVAYVISKQDFYWSMTWVLISLIPSNIHAML